MKVKHRNLGQALLLSMLGVVCVFIAPGVTADSDRRSDTEEVAALMYCCAKGTDTIGDAVTNQNPLAAGLDLTLLTFNPVFQTGQGCSTN